MTCAHHDSLLVLVKLGAANGVRQTTKPTDGQVNLIAFELASNLEAIQREHS